MNKPTKIIANNSYNNKKSLMKKMWKIIELIDEYNNENNISSVINQRG